MIPPQFDYVRPSALAEVLQILKDREGEAKILSGGYSLIPLLRLRLARPGLLVDLRDVGGLDGIAEAGDGLRIGARATHRRIHQDPIVAARYPLLHDASALIGDPQVRNWGTIGGSCAHADPSADWPAVLIASRATIVCRSLAGDRTVAARDFFLDTFLTAIEPTEVLTEVRVPPPGAGSGGAYEKLERKAGDFATAGAAVQVTLGTDGTIAAAGVALSAVAQTCIAVNAAELAIVGARPGPQAEAALRRACASTANPVRDAHGPVEYKRAMAGEMAVRALRRALARAAA